MIFLNPTYLWALLGLAVPIAIHLWSKKEGRTIKIGSIQLLQESDPKQTSNLKLNEIWLLLLRLLAITILVLILAEPQLKHEGEKVPITYIVEPSLLNFDEVNAIIDTLAEGGAVIKLLEPDFPEYQKDLQYSSAEVPNYWQLASKMQDLDIDSIVVFTNAFQSGIKGKRPQISKNINWVILDPGTSSERFVYATSFENNVELISAKVDSENLGFEKKTLPISSEDFLLNEQKDSITISASGKEYKLPLKTADSLSVFIYYEEDFSAGMKYIEASFAALSKYLERPIEITTAQESNDFDPEKYSAVIWLSESPVERSEAALLRYKPDSLANSIITASLLEDEYYLTGRLNSENVLEQHLPEKLFPMLNLHPDFQENVQQYDRRVMDKNEFLPVQTAGVSGKGFSEVTDLTKYLWLLLLALLVAERGLAYYRKQ